MRLHPLVSLALTGLVALATGARAESWNSVTVSWTAPGDDGMTGVASAFDLRYSTSPITAASFGSATRWTSTPAPAAPGTTQSVTVTGLLPSTTYYFAIETADEVPNWSSISNVVSRTTSPMPDAVRPAPLTIAVTSVTDSSASLGWTAVGDDSLNGTVSSYDIRYSTSPITATSWSGATQVTGEPLPAAPGTPQSCTVRGLSREVTYFFAARAVDDAGNLSALSNVPSVTTLDSMPPGPITNLSVGFVWLGWHSSLAIRPRSAEARGR